MKLNAKRTQILFFIRRLPSSGAATKKAMLNTKGFFNYEKREMRENLKPKTDGPGLKKMSQTEPQDTENNCFSP